LKARRSQSTSRYSNRKASQSWWTTGFTAALSRDGTAGARGIAQAVADGGEFRETPENWSEQGEDGGALRTESVITMDWIAQRLRMGCRQTVANWQIGKLFEDVLAYSTIAGTDTFPFLSRD